MINISEEIKSFVDEVEFFGGKFNPFFVDEDNKLLIHLDSVINKHRFNDKMIIEAIFLMYKKFETRDIKADIEVRIILKDRKIQSVYYEPQYMAVIEEEGDPYIENRSDLIYFQSMYIVSYYKGDSEYKFKLFIRIKYNRFSKKVANITVHIDDNEVNGEYDKILSTNILNILIAQTSVCYNHLLRSALNIALR